MTKVVLNSALSTYDVGIINANFAKVQAELQNKVLYRDNPTGEPNTLETDVNANNKRIYNLPEPTTSGEPLRLEDLENVAGDLQDAVEASEDAQAAAAAANISASSALSSQSNAAISAAAASASELDAENAASSAAGSANTATVQANVATTKAAEASLSASSASTSETNAATSAAAALISENNAADSEDAAAASAAAAAGAVIDHINDIVGAHAATAISNTPSGAIAATTVQAAINELDTEKLSATATTLPATFTASSLTSVGTLTALTVSGLASITASSASAALTVTQTGSGNAFVVEDSASDGTPFVVSASGQLIVGNTTTFAASTLTPGVNFQGVAGTDGANAIGLNGFSNDAGGPSIHFGKSRSATIGAHTVVASDDLLGALFFEGSDGTAQRRGAAITAFVDGTPGTNDMPGRLVFSTTANGASSPTTRVTIDNAGNVGIGGTAAAGRTLAVSRNLTGSTTSRGITAIGQVQSDVTTAGTYFATLASTANGFTLPLLKHYTTLQGAFSGTVTTQMGFSVESTLTGAGTNYGFHSDIAAAAGRFNFYAAGTAANYFAGATSFASTISVSGQASFAAGSAAAPSVKVGAEQNGMYSDGTGSLSFATAGARVVRMGTVGGTGNYLRLDANNTPLISAVAGATNADIGLVSAGTGSIFLATNGSIATTQVRVSHIASAVNYWDFTGAATGSGIRVDATGSDSGVNGFFVAKGSGVWNFCTSGSSSNRQLQVGHVASAVNYGLITGSTTGNAVTVSAAGSDTNIDMAFTPKGSGVLRFGTHSAIGIELVTGYITIKDAAGNTRKLAVIS